MSDKWFNGTNWRLHPDWHYCRPNDTDYMMTKEEIFAHYLKLMKEGNKIPDKCKLKNSIIRFFLALSEFNLHSGSNYSFLINRLLFDAKVTCQMDSCWISQSRRDARYISSAIYTTSRRYSLSHRLFRLHHITSLAHYTCVILMRNAYAHHVLSRYEFSVRNHSLWPLSASSADVESWYFLGKVFIWCFSPRRQA